MMLMGLRQLSGKKKIKIKGKNKMNFEELRAELAKNKNLNYYTLSGYGSVRGNKLIQIYKAEWMPCKFINQPLELHFEIQDNRILRLDCHWYPYYQYKNLNREEFIKKFPQLENLIKERKMFISGLSKEAQAACTKTAHLKQVKFNAINGVEWSWEDIEDWKDIADEIAEIVLAVSPCVDNHFGTELNNF